MVLNLSNRISSWWIDFSKGNRGGFRSEALFSRLVYLWILINGVFLFPVLELTLGGEGYAYRSAFEPTLRDNLVYMLNYLPQRVWLVYSMMMLASALALLNMGGLIIRVMAWLGLLLIASAGSLIFNSAIKVAFNWAFLLVFLFPLKTTPWKIILSRLSFLGLKIQFLIIYFFSGVFKIRTEDWIEGDSIRILSFLPHYTPQWLADIFQSMTWMSMTLNYVIMFYLILFPFLVWIRRIKGHLMIVGIGFHFYTAIVMGLYDFGTIMLIGYVLFLSENQVTWLIEKLDRIPLLKLIVLKIKM